MVWVFNSTNTKQFMTLDDVQLMELAMDSVAELGRRHDYHPIVGAAQMILNFQRWDLAVHRVRMEDIARNN